MINTIFYYPQTLTFEEYLNQLGSEIAARTIVFAKDQKSIYMGGKKFGASSASDISDLKQYIENVLEDNSITNKIEEIINTYYNTTPQDLPTASTTKKGCIKVGSGLVMGNDEKLNVDFSNLPSGQNGIDGLDGLVEQIIKTDTSARASYTNFGVVRVAPGTGIICNNGVISAEFTQGPQGEPGPQGAQGPQGIQGPAGPSYDDTYIRDLIDDNISDLQELIRQFDDKVKRQVESLLEDVDWMQENWPSGSGSTSNFGQQDVESYLQTIGVWEENEAHTKLNAKWSKIAQSVDSVTTRVAALELNAGQGGTSTGTSLTAEQLLAIQKVGDLETAVNSLSTTYTQFQLNEDRELKVVKWLSSALGLYSNQNATWTNLASAADNTELGQSGIAALNTRVTSLEQGLVAAANLSTLVQDEVTSQINSAGFVAQSDLTDYATVQSVSTMYATVEGKADQALASISAMVEYETEPDGEGGTRLKNYGTELDPIYKLASKVIIDADDITIGERESTGGISWFSNHRALSEAIKVGADYWPEGNFASAFEPDPEYLDAQIAIYKDAIVLNTDTFATQFQSTYLRAGGNNTETNMVRLNSDGIQMPCYGTYSFTAPGRNIYPAGSETADFYKGEQGVVISFHDITVPGTVTSNAISATNLTATNLSVTSSFSTSNDFTAGGDITADGDMLADNLNIRNRGNITVGTNGNVISPKFTVGNTGQQGVITYYGSDNQVKFDSGIWADGDSRIDGSLEITDSILISAGTSTAGTISCETYGGRTRFNLSDMTYVNGDFTADGDVESTGGLTVDGETTLKDDVEIQGNLSVTGDAVFNSIRVGAQDYGTTGTLVIDGNTITIKEGIITNVSGSGWTAGA